jgi:hypothetical protein
MRKPLYLFLIASIVAILLTLSACKHPISSEITQTTATTTTTTTVPTTVPTVEDDLAIYTISIRDLYNKWIENFYLFKTGFPPVVQEGISAGLSDLPFRIIWVDSAEQIQWDSEHYDIIDGAELLLSIKYSSNTEASIQINMVCGMLCGTGWTYLLEKIDGVWVIKERRLDAIM